MYYSPLFYPQEIKANTEGRLREDTEDDVHLRDKIGLRGTYL